MIRSAIIMAGGAGERFWPLSRKNKPKQLLELTSSGSMMIQEAINRVEGIIEKENIFIITGESLKEPIQNALPELPKENIIAEPYKRNTAPCLALGASVLVEKYALNEVSVAVLTADHIMQPLEKFKQTVESCLLYAENSADIITIGIVPSRAETGYGYIHSGDFLSEINGVDFFKTNSFKEKPDKETAKEYFNSSVYFWNSGMFFYKLDTFVNSMQKYSPKIGGKILEMKLGSNDLSEIFERLPSISIDYALMEKADNIVMAKAIFDWDDIGAFDSLFRANKPDENGNIIKGNAIALNTYNSIIININPKTLATAYGLNGMIQIISEDASMTCKLEDAQNVKLIVEYLKEKEIFGVL